MLMMNNFMCLARIDYPTFTETFHVLLELFMHNFETPSTKYVFCNVPKLNE